MKATIISTGAELVAGRTVDTNAAFLAAGLVRPGFSVQRLLAVGDDPDALRDEVVRCSQDSALIIVTGGLGPTADDRTRGAIAQAVGRELVEDTESRRHVEDRLRSFGHPLTERHLRQAFFPAGSKVFPNPVGTARGFGCRVNDTWVVAMPGVPREMRSMFRESVLPFLLQELAPSDCVIVETVNIFPASESEVDARISDLTAPDRNPTTGITVGDGVISISLRSQAAQEDQARQLIRRDVRLLEERFGDLIFGYGDTTLAHAVSDLLERRQLSIGVAESVTGGLVGDMLVDVPGISRFLLADIVAYANETKVEQLGVPREQVEAHGAVSRQVAESMARGICVATGADLGVSTTGIAGPSGGSGRKPVGLVYVGVCLDGGAKAARLNLRGDRRQIRDRAAKHALNVARLVLLKGLDSLALPPYNVADPE